MISRTDPVILTHANIFASVLLKSAANILNNSNSCKCFCVSWANFLFFSLYTLKVDQGNAVL